MKYKPLIAALAAWAIAHALDIISTALTCALVPGVGESNPFMADKAGHPVFAAMFLLKGLALLFMAPLIAGIYAVTKEWKWACIPLFYNVWGIIWVAGSNFGMLYVWLARGQ